MAKTKVFGVLESPSVLLEPVDERRYTLAGDKAAAELVGTWVTVAGEIDGRRIEEPEIVNVEKYTGRVTRAGVIVDSAPNLPPEATDQGGYLYQESKGRYFLLSEGNIDEPIRGDYSQYVGKPVRVTGTFADAPYILYKTRVSEK